MPRRTEPDPYAAKIGARIRELRVEHNMSLADLAMAAGLSKGHLSTIELGFAAITIETIGRLAKALELPSLCIILAPDEDDRDHVMDLVCKLPRQDVIKLRRTLQAAVKQAAKTTRATS